MVPQVAEGRGKIPPELIDRIAGLAPAGRSGKGAEAADVSAAHAGDRRACPFPQLSGQASGRYRLREALILPGQEYHVTGTCVENPEAREAQDRNMIVQGQNEKTFLISWKAEQGVQTGAAQAGGGHGVWRGGPGAGLPGFAAVAFGMY